MLEILWLCDVELDVGNYVAEWSFVGMFDATFEECEFAASVWLGLCICNSRLDVC